MKFWYSPYKLKFKNAYNKLEREGFLLKLQHHDFEAGYADCFPWPEFGDLSVKALLKVLKERDESPLIEKTIHFAHKDGVARASKQSLIVSSLS